MQEVLLLTTSTHSLRANIIGRTYENAAKIHNQLYDLGFYGGAKVHVGQTNSHAHGIGAHDGSDKFDCILFMLASNWRLLGDGNLESDGTWSWILVRDC